MRFTFLAVTLLAMVGLGVTSCNPVSTEPPAAATAQQVSTSVGPNSPASAVATTNEVQPEASNEQGQTTATSDTEAGATGELPPEVVTALDEFLVRVVDVGAEGTTTDETCPGIVLLMDTPEGRYLKSSGVADMESLRPMETGDRLEIGSNTKSFTIVLLLQLQEEGALDLDDPLSKWLPDWAEKIPYGDEITLRQLAQHTSGVRDYGDPIIAAGVEDPELLVRAFTPDELLQYALELGEPSFRPGEEGKWEYSNTGYVLLGMVIEKAAGAPLGDLYQQRIFDPLDLNSAVFIEDVPTEEQVTTKGYWFEDDGSVIDTTRWNASQGWAAGAMAMTAEDLLTYAKALGAGELFESPESLQQMLTFDPNGLDGMLPYGLGLIDFGRAGLPGYWGHEGQTPGFQSLWYTNPHSGVTVIGLTNSGVYSAFGLLDLMAQPSQEREEE
jgi:D-alanyl-D-alanine carboxypeptidase